MAVDLSLFNHLPNTPDGLTSIVNADSGLLSRLLRLLASAHVVAEVQPGTFAPTNFSAALTKPGYIGGFGSMFYDILPTCLTLPEYLASTNYQNPTSASETPFMSTKGMSYFQWLGTNTQAGVGFNDLMAEWSNQAIFRWTEVYPLSHITSDPAVKTEGEDGPPLVVDVGGGLGTNMELLRSALISEDKTSSNTAVSPNLPKLVVQDVASVVAEGEMKHPDLTFMIHNFFTPQPIAGARAYFLRNILHDWPDEKAGLILQNLKEAMGARSSWQKPGTSGAKSKLLLEENVMYDMATDVTSESMDFVMMGLLSGSERSEGQWRSLLGRAGFNVLKVWRGVGTARAVIEAELADED